MAAAKGTWLVTGVSGFVGLNVAKAAADAGYHVRGTVRSIERHKEALTKVVPDIELVEADFSTPHEEWVKAAQGCTGCCHVASPFPLAKPKSEDELIKPAVDGTLLVLKACKEAGITRVVVTSSCAAVYECGDKGKVNFGPEDFSEVERCDAYHKSKTLAEKAAREYAKEAGLELFTVNPSMIQGPLLQGRDCSSSDLCKSILEGMPFVPPAGIPWCDVRDVAELHVKALESGTPGGRYLCSEATVYLNEAAVLLKENFGDRYNVKTSVPPKFAVQLASFFDSQAAGVLKTWNLRRVFDCSASVELLGRPLMPATDAIVAMAESIDKFDMAKKKKKAK
eukprot:m.434770 g.434770  ORF g.434770 m.434770 type:complete len:338 (-) comp17764_c0_seq1:127-1140(-)